MPSLAAPSYGRFLLNQVQFFDGSPRGSLYSRFLCVSERQDYSQWETRA